MSFPTIPSSPNLIRLSLSSNKYDSVIRMKLPENLLTTHSLPHVYDFLSNHLPSIFSSTCYNPDNLLFSDEVKKTEIAHLFEHIVLEYLVMNNKSDSARSYEGVTSWDWRREARGTFKIKINVGSADSFLLAIAIDKAYKLLFKLLDAHRVKVN